MKKSFFAKLLVAFVAVVGFAAGLPAEAARAVRPPTPPVQPPAPVSGL